MLGLNITRIATAALALVGFGLSTTPAIADESTRCLNITYNLTNGGRLISQELAEIFVSGESTDAPSGLNKLNGLTYLETNAATGLFTANTDPTKFGLDDFPQGSFVLEGDGKNKLVGTESSNGISDFETLKITNYGIIDITGGEGKFKGATGRLFFIENSQRSADPTAPVTGQLTVNGCLQIDSKTKNGYKN